MIVMNDVRLTLRLMEPLCDDHPVIGSERADGSLPLARDGKFTSAEEMIDEALRLVEERYQGAEDAADRTARQLDNLQRLGRSRLDAMPVTTVTDGLSNRDHDRMLCDGQ